MTFPVSGTGSAGMEACFVNLLEPGDTAIIGVNGVFGERMCEVARRCGADVVRVEAPWGRALDPHKCSPRTAPIPGRGCSPSCTPRPRPASRTISPRSPRCRDTDTLLVVDTVTSLGRLPVEVDGWGIDACYSGTQKCLGVPPGLAPLSFSERARSHASAVGPTLPSPGTSTSASSRATSAVPARYHHTAPISMLSLHAGLGAILDEGLDASWARHRRVGARLQHELPDLGFRLLAEEIAASRSSRRSGSRRRRRHHNPQELLAPFRHRGRRRPRRFAGQGWRIGLMGHGARDRNVTTLLGALNELL